MKKEPRLKTLKMGIATSSYKPVPVLETRSQAVRIRGNALQEKRKRWWINSPHCKACGVFTVYPHGFQLDHIIELAIGGEETDENTQLLCISCHDAKTKAAGF